MSASWWGAFGSVLAAAATGAAVWVSVVTARTARRETVAAREAEAAAEKRAQAAEEDFRGQQFDYERRRDAEERQARRDAEAVHLFDSHGRNLRFYSAWSEAPTTLNMNGHLQVTVENLSLVPFSDLKVEFFGRLHRYQQPEAWCDLETKSHLAGNTTITPTHEIPRPADGELPPVRVTFTDENHHRWLIDEFDVVTLLAPRTIRAASEA